MQREGFSPARGYDWFLAALTLLFCLLGILLIANATADPYITSEHTGLYAALDRIDSHYPLRQILFLGLGLLLAAAATLLPRRLYQDVAPYLFAGMCVVLLATKFLGTGRSDMNGWIRITESISIQPSELCKPVFILTLSRHLTRREEPISTARELLPVLGHIALPVGLILYQPDYGTAMVYLAIAAGMLVLSGASWKLLLGLFAAGTASLVPLWFVIGQFRQERILNYLDPARDVTGSGLQVNNSKIAIGSGQLTGKGFLREGAISQLDFVPEKHTDFIFSVTAESVGFVGSAALVGLYLVLILYLLVKARRAPDRYSSLVVAGAASMLLFHTFENLGMCMGLMPVTGIPLPFLSYGGSNLWANLIVIGLVLNMTRKRKRGMFVQTEP